MASIFKCVLELIFPASCVGCGSGMSAANPSGWICGKCLAGIRINSGIFCDVCGRRLAIGPAASRCPVHHWSKLRAVGAVGDYSDPVLKEMIIKYKYRFVRELAEPLATLAAAYFANSMRPYIGEPAVLVPIPLAGRRQRWRGFNQASELAALTAAKINLPVAEALRRTRYEKPQAAISRRKHRFENVKDAFSVIRPEIVKNRHIILVDDVATSGATLEAAATSLRQAGAKAVWGLVIARNS